MSSSSLPSIQPLSREARQLLSEYTACDISDVLSRLKVPGAGFLPDITLRSPNPNTPTAPTTKIIAPASTVLFIPKSSTTPPPTTNTPLKSLFHKSPTPPPPPTTTDTPLKVHFADLTPASTIVLISQPPNQHNAVLGGLVAARIKILGALGVVVDGRIRDLGELWDELDGFPVWAKGTSTVGAGRENKAVCGGVVEIAGMKIYAGDIIFADGLNGVVVIPQDKLDQVLEMLPRIAEAEEKVRVDVLKNSRSLRDALEEHRKGL